MSGGRVRKGRVHWALVVVLFRKQILPRGFCFGKFVCKFCVSRLATLFARRPFYLVCMLFLSFLLKKLWIQYTKNFAAEAIRLNASSSGPRHLLDRFHGDNPRVPPKNVDDGLQRASCQQKSRSCPDCITEPVDFMNQKKEGMSRSRCPWFCTSCPYACPAWQARGLATG